MQTDSPEAIEFRCNSCWQTNYAPVSQQEQEFTCVHCEHVLTVPKATPDRVRSKEVLTTQAVVSPVVQPAAAPIEQETPRSKRQVDLASEAEQMQWVREQTENLNECDFGNHENASLLARLCASILDSIFLSCSFGISVLMLVGADSLKVIELPTPGGEPKFDLGILAIASFAPLVALILQWNLIATRGQTVGKFVCGIRIINLSGRLPGFINGVIIRNWVRVLLSFIPLFGLVDILFIFGSSRRCIHDLLAGTRVVNT